MLAILSGHRVVLPGLDMKLTYNTGLLEATSRSSEPQARHSSVAAGQCKNCEEEKNRKSSLHGEKTSATFLGGGFSASKYEMRRDRHKFSIACITVFVVKPGSLGIISY